MVNGEVMFGDRLEELDRAVLDFTSALTSLNRTIMQPPPSGYTPVQISVWFRRMLRDYLKPIDTAITRFDEALKGIYHCPDFSQKQVFIARLQVDIKYLESIEKQIYYWEAQRLDNNRDYLKAKAFIDRLITNALRKLNEALKYTSRRREFYLVR